jgi:hypothetical protein
MPRQQAVSINRVCRDRICRRRGSLVPRIRKCRAAPERGPKTHVADPRLTLLPADDAISEARNWRMRMLGFGAWVSGVIPSKSRSSGYMHPGSFRRPLIRVELAADNPVHRVARASGTARGVNGSKPWFNCLSASIV